MNDQTAVSPIANGILDDVVSANHTDDMMMDQGAEVPETTENQEDGQQDHDQENIDGDDEEEEEHNESRLELEEENNEEEQDDEDEEEEEEEGSSRKRQRRSTSSFTPADFKHEPHRPIDIPAGRGVKLGDIGPIHSNVNKRNSTDPILLSLHKFLLGGPGGCLGKGRTSKNLVKKHILDFSGYLPPLKKETEVVEKGEDNVQEEKEQEVQEEGHDVVKEETGEEKEQDQGEGEGVKGDGEEAREEEEVKAGEEEGKEKEEGEREEREGEMEDEEEEMEDEEEEAEERMIAKAEKLSLPLLKSFCDILCLDRRPVDGKVPNKNMLIDRLLDFLAEPSPDGIDAEACSPKKRGRKPKNQQQQQHKEESGMDVDEEEEVDSPKRKRGRPRKQRDESAEDSEVKVPKKRGRPRKQKEETPVEHGEDESGEDEDGDKKENGLSADALMEKDLRKFARSYTFLFFDEKASMEHAFELATEKFGSKLDDGKKEMLTALMMKAKGTPKKK